jgi:hypothetical protein
VSAATVAGVRSVLVGAADVIERAGWCQSQPRDLTGSVCVREALRIAADGDLVTMYDALTALERRLPAYIDVVRWQDQSHRTKAQVLAFLRDTAAVLTPANVCGWPPPLQLVPPAGDPPPPAVPADSFMTQTFGGAS